MNEKLKKILNATDVAAIILLTFIFLSGLIFILTQKNIKWVNIIFDDAYYYLGIARNIVENGSSSFNTPFQTNGYQPLWLFILCLSAYLFGTSETSLVIQIFTLSFIFVGVFSYASRIKFGYAFPAIAACVSFPSVTLIGMETALIPILIFGLFNAKKWQSKGILSSLLFLARLDALAFIFANDIYKFLVKKEVDIRQYLILAPVIIIYFYINYAIFGTAVPVSGLSKSVGNVIGENFSIYINYIFSIKITIAFLSVIFICNFFEKNKIKIEYLDEIIISTLSVILISTYYALMSGWPLWSWYFWPALIAYFYIILSSLKYIELIFSKNSLSIFRYFPVFLISIIVLFPLKTAAGFTIQSFLQHNEKNKRSSYGEKNIELVELIKKDTNVFVPGSFFAMGDRAGSFGFFLGNSYSFIHTEGLVGSYEYYTHMKNDNGAKFLRETGAKYLIADRERFMTHEGIIGVVEPVQGMSAKFGPYILCFKKEEIVLDQSYVGHENNARYMFDLEKEVPCPEVILSDFKNLRSKYGALRGFTFPSDYTQDRGVIKNFINKIIPLPLGV